MWERDAVIDPDNLHNESLKISELHSKYYTIYNTISLLREKARGSYSSVKLERYNYYTGKAPAEKLTNIDLKIKYYDTQLKFLEEIIRNISQRTFQIKNAIEWQKFQAGF